MNPSPTTYTQNPPPSWVEISANQLRVAPKTSPTDWFGAFVFALVSVLLIVALTVTTLTATTDELFAVLLTLGGTTVLWVAITAFYFKQNLTQKQLIVHKSGVHIRQTFLGHQTEQFFPFGAMVVAPSLYKDPYKRLYGRLSFTNTTTKNSATFDLVRGTQGADDQIHQDLHWLIDVLTQHNTGDKEQVEADKYKLESSLQPLQSPSEGTF